MAYFEGMEGDVIGARVTLEGAEKAAADAKLVSAEVKGIGDAAVEADAKAAAAGAEQGGLGAFRRAAQGISSALGSIKSGIAGGIGNIKNALAGVDTQAARVGAGLKTIGDNAATAGFVGGGALGRFGGVLSGVEDKAAGVVGTLTKIGGATVLAIGVAAGAVAYESAKMASSFNKEMSLIQTQAHAGAQEINGVRDGALSLAGKTAQGPNVLAEGLYHIESNGLRGKDALSALNSAAEGATTGHANLVDVTNALGAVIAAKMVPGVHNYNAAMGILNATVGSGDMHMQDLADAMGGGMLATVAGFGVSIKDVGAALATFGDNNVRGANAGTQLRMSVQALAKPAQTGAATIAALGLSQDTLAKDMQKGGLNAAIVDLHNHLDKAGITGDKVGATLTDAFGKRAGTGVNILLQQFDRFQSKYKDVDEGAAKFGADWKATTEQLSFKVDALKKGAEALGIRIGEKVIPAFEHFVSALITAGRWLDHHKVVLAAIGGIIGAVLIPAIIAFGITAVATAGEMLIAWGPFLLLGAAIGGAIYEIATHWGDVKQWARDAFDFIKRDVLKPFLDFFLDIAGNVIHAAASMFGWVPGIGGKLKDAERDFDAFKATIDGALTPVQQKMADAMGTMDQFNQKAAQLGSNISQVGASAQGTLTQYASANYTTGGRAAHFAAGGIVTAPTFALVGESGPEVVLPLNDPLRAQALLYQAGALAAGGYTPQPSMVPQTSIASVPAMASIAGDSLPTVPSGSIPQQPVVLQVMLDRKVLAQAVYDETKSRVARQ